jgi:hypothetical protein
LVALDPVDAMSFGPQGSLRLCATTVDRASPADVEGTMGKLVVNISMSLDGSPTGVTHLRYRVVR